VSREFTFEGSLWLYEGKGAWHFITLPRAVASQIKKATAVSKQAFGTVRVLAIVGGTHWKTAIFLDTKRGTYLLPIKAEVRRREQVQAGMVFEISILIEAEEEME
jgi:hypothetical protein